jgi:signal transduction histidine kinase
MHTLFFLTVTGIGLFIAIVNVLQYFVNSDKAYLFYAVYVGISSVNTYQLAIFDVEHFAAIPTTWSFTFVQRLCIISYLAFSIAFFKNDKVNESILKIWTKVTSFFVFLCVIEVLVYVFVGNQPILWQTQSYFTILRFALSFICIYNIRYIQSPLRTFYLIGTSLLWIGVFVGKAFPSTLAQPNVLYLNPYFYNIVFFLLENICLTIGLSYRSNLILQQRQALVDQEHHEKEQMRHHIAADLHDDLGAGLSTIRLLGERAELGTDSVEKNIQIHKITVQANDLIEKMSTIIWAMNSEHDTIESLVHYLRYYAFDYVKDTHNTELLFPLPDFPPSVLLQTVAGDDRREIFLTVKEALHNIVKHAEATTVYMSISLKDNCLVVNIGDNGKGINENRRMGNGIKNMTKRMSKMGGDFHLSNKIMGGVDVILRLPLTKVSVPI